VFTSEGRDCAAVSSLEQFLLWLGGSTTCRGVGSQVSTPCCHGLVRIGKLGGDGCKGETDQICLNFRPRVA
jgi:hypothetical protein